MVASQTINSVFLLIRCVAMQFAIKIRLTTPGSILLVHWTDEKNVFPSRNSVQFVKSVSKLYYL